MNRSTLRVPNRRVPRIRRQRKITRILLKITRLKVFWKRVVRILLTLNRVQDRRPLTVLQRLLITVFRLEILRKEENVEDLNGTRAQVVSGGMKFYTPQTPPSAKIHMDTKLDGETAVLTVGTANGNSNDATAGTIRNEPKRYAAYMDLTMDFLSGNKNLMEANKRYGLKDLKELQGFKLNRLPSWDELAVQCRIREVIRSRIG